MAQCSEDELYQKADNLLRNAGQHFQFLFHQRWKVLSGADWNGEESAQVLVEMMGVQFSKLLQPLQRKQVKKGVVEGWDITLLSRLLIYFNKEKDEEASNNKAILSLTTVRNKLAHNGRKKLTFEEYTSIEILVKKNLIILGMDEKAIQKIINLAEATSMNSALEQFKKLQAEGDKLFEKKSYKKAIELYSEAMILPNLPSGYVSILHEKRAFSHLSLSSQKRGKLKEAQLDLALSDGEKAIGLNSSSWRGHHVLALISQARSKMDEAQMHFSRALAISPGEAEVKSDFDTCKILSGKIARDEHLDPGQMPMNLSERVTYFNDETGHGISEETYLEMGERLGQLYPGQDHVQTGHQHAAGWGVPQNYSEAARHYATAAKVGNAEGIFNLANLYKDGLGVKCDIPHAIELYLEAASKPPRIGKKLGFSDQKNVGALSAQHSLGLLHEEGMGVPKDKVKAAYWYKKAADNGWGRAANNLAILYSKGDGVPLNEKMAEMYWKIAVEDKSGTAAYSLYFHYLERMEPQLARSYFNTAIQLGHDRLKASKTQVFEMIEKVEKERRECEDKVKAFEKENNLSIKGLSFLERMKRYASTLSPLTATLVKDVEELRAAQKWAGKVKNELDIQELSWKSEQGSTTASSILKCMENNFYFIKIWDQGPPRSRVEIEKLVAALYNCLTTEAHHFKIPRDMYGQVLKCLNELFQSVGGEKSKLDMQLRLCLPFLHFMSGGLEEFHAELLEEGLQRYPDEIPLYRDLADVYFNLREYSKGLQVTIKGLLKAPNDPQLLYSKAVCLRQMDEGGVNKLEIREAFKAFIENAPGDHRKFPEAYYGIAMTYMMEMKKKKESKEMLFYYYGMGEDAEKVQLKCYLPYESSHKILLKNIVMVLTKDVEAEKLVKGKSDAVNKVGGVSERESEESKLYLKDPKRIATIKKHRELAVGMRKLPAKSVSGTNAPKLVHKIPKALTDLQTIKLNEMNPTKDRIYEGRILNLTLIEEPNFGFPSIHSIAEDDNGEATRLYIYNVEQNEQTRKTFGVGAKISVITPYMRIAQDLTNGIRVDDPKCVIHMEGVEDMCRYCGKEGAKSSCSRCMKAKYCGKKCQETDWKVLKHKLICC